AAEQAKNPRTAAVWGKPAARKPRSRPMQRMSVARASAGSGRVIASRRSAGLKLPVQPFRSVAEHAPDLQVGGEPGEEHEEHAGEGGAEEQHGNRHAVQDHEPQVQYHALAGVQVRDVADDPEEQDAEDQSRATDHATCPSASGGPAGSPMNVAPVVSVRRTGMKHPMSDASPGKATTLLESVRPSTSPGVRASRSTSTSTVRPTSPRLISAWISRCKAMSSSSRACASSGSTNCSRGSRVAGVPSRGEYLYMKASSNRTSRTRSSVASNSSRVSPGNATMMSVDSAIPGIASRTIRTRSRNVSTV